MVAAGGLCFFLEKKDILRVFEPKMDGMAGSEEGCVVELLDRVDYARVKNHKKGKLRTEENQNFERSGERRGGRSGERRQRSTGN